MAAEPNSNRVTCMWVQEHRAKHKPPWLRMGSKELVSLKQLSQVQQLSVSIFTIKFMLKGNLNPQENVGKRENLKKKHIGMGSVIVLLQSTRTRQSIPRRGIMHEHKHINATCCIRCDYSSLQSFNNDRGCPWTKWLHSHKVGLSDCHIVPF